MREIFLKVLEMSVSGSVVIAAVLALRLLLRGAPKAYSYALWALVLIRLLCPVEIKSPVGLTRADAGPRYVLTEPAQVPAEVETPGATVATGQVLPGGTAPDRGTDTDKGTDIVRALAWVWLSGAAAMVTAGSVRLAVLKRRLIGAAAVGGGVYAADHIGTAFVLGVVRPRIYIPSWLDGEGAALMAAHERWHIRRGDNIWRALAALALTAHWFNPLVWLAFRLSGQDMEMSCDEHVLRGLDSTAREDYAGALLRCGVYRREVPAAIAFGAGNVRRRIMNALDFKKPRVWVCIGAVAVIAVAAVILLTVRGGGEAFPKELEGYYKVREEYPFNTAWTVAPEWPGKADLRAPGQDSGNIYYYLGENGELAVTGRQLVDGALTPDTDIEAVGESVEVELTEENFTDCFHYDGKWHTENMLGSTLLRENRRAWMVDIPDDYAANERFALILEQEGGDVWLAFGCRRAGSEGELTPDNAFIFEARRLEPYVAEDPANRPEELSSVRSYGYPHGYSSVIEEFRSETEDTMYELDVFLWDKYTDDPAEMENLGVRYMPLTWNGDSWSYTGPGEDTWEYKGAAKEAEFVTPDIFEMDGVSYKVKVTRDDSGDEGPIFRAELTEAQ